MYKVIEKRCQFFTSLTNRKLVHKNKSQLFKKCFCRKATRVTIVIIWEMHGFPHKFPALQENATKSMLWGKSGKLILILFP